MFIDISIEYNCSGQEFTPDNVIYYCENSQWVAYHTDKGKTLFDNIDLTANVNERILLTPDKIKEIRKLIKEYKLSYIIGGFYWNDIKHLNHK